MNIMTDMKHEVTVAAVAGNNARWFLEAGCPALAEIEARRSERRYRAIGFHLAAHSSRVLAAEARTLAGR